MTEIDVFQTTNSAPLLTGVRRCWLIRHGLTQWNSELRYCSHTDVSLSSEGMEQARWLAYRLQHIPIAAIYTSDLQRTIQTADLILQYHAQSIPLYHSAAWRELDFGIWEGLTYAQIVQQFPSQLDFFTDPLHHSSPEGESLQELSKRVRVAFADIIRDISQSNRTGDIVLVSHGGPLRVLLCHVLGLSLEHQWKLRLDPGSLSAIDIVPIDVAPFFTASLALLNVQHIPGKQIDENY